MKYIYIILVLVFLGLIFLAENCKAETIWRSYYTQEVPYIFHNGKPLPEMTKYECVNGKLTKWKYGIEYMYTGKAKKCEVKVLTRKEYEEFNTM